jgi:hypothetical protein
VSIWKCLPLLVPVLLCGCVTGFDRDALRERLNDGTLQSPDAAIVEARGLKPQLRFPCRIAVYLKPEGHDWRWTPEDKAAMEGWTGALKKDGIAADVFPLPEMLAGKGEKGDLKELRLAAAKCGADVLLVIHGAADTLRHMNPLAVFNLTIVGGYVVPGSSRDSLFMLEGVLVDVDNGYVYTGIQAEGTGKIMRPTFVIEDKDAIAVAKSKALAQFGDEFLRRMRRLKVGPAFISDVNSGPIGFEIPKEPGRSGRIIIEGNDVVTDRVIKSQLDLRPGDKTANPVYVSDINAKGVTIGLTPAGTYAPDLDVPIRKAQQNAGGVMTGITAPKPNP